MYRTTSFVLILITSCFASACDQTERPKATNTKSSEKLPDISKMTDAEINKLPEETIARISAKTLFARIEGGLLAPMIEKQMTQSLAALWYLEPSPEQTRAAILKFQRDLGQAQTGDLTTGQYKLLDQRAALASERSFRVSGMWDKLHVFTYEKSHVSTEGTWVLEGEEMAFPVNSAKITCIKAEGQCTHDEVDIQLPSLNRENVFGDNYTIFHQQPEHYEIISWTNSEVISELARQCRTTTLTINTVTKEVFQVTRNNGGNCDFVDKLKKPRIARLLASGNVMHEYWERRKTKTAQFRNADNKDMLDDISAKLKARDKEK